MPDPTQPRRCTCKGNRCGKRHGRYVSSTCDAMVSVGVICDECWVRMNAKSTTRQHRTPQMPDTFADCSLPFGGKK